jgi:hypothetical protein
LERVREGSALADQLLRAAQRYEHEDGSDQPPLAVSATLGNRAGAVALSDRVTR